MSLNYYMVKNGDTLYSIAKKYNTTPDELKKINNLSSNTITIGQFLKLPMVSSNTYEVKSGDTLYKIAMQNNTTVQELKDLNSLESNLLSIGQVLLIPNTEFLNIPTSNIEYMVQQGDTLYSIAKKYNTTVDKIKQQNNLSDNLLSVGKKLLIPVMEMVEIPTSTITYIVKAGDTLYSIAREFNTTVNNIKSQNNLTNNLLKVGQSLLISP